MARLRFTIKEAERESERLATDYLRLLPNTESARFNGALPDRTASKSSATKIPVVWVVSFVFHPSEVVMDGGELILDVNIETKEVSPWPRGRASP